LGAGGFWVLRATLVVSVLLAALFLLLLLFFFFLLAFFLLETAAGPAHYREASFPISANAVNEGTRATMRRCKLKPTLDIPLDADWAASAGAEEAMVQIAIGGAGAGVVVVEDTTAKKTSNVRSRVCLVRGSTMKGRTLPHRSQVLASRIPFLADLPTSRGLVSQAIPVTQAIRATNGRS
jgi:hypothetical protein